MIINIQKSLALILLVSLNSNATTNHLPNVVIRNIQNDTTEDVTISDRSNKSREILIAAGKTVDVNLKSNNQSVAIQGSMKECMAAKAQFVIKKATDKEQEVYLNVNAAQGGINDGSGMICGTPGTIALKFLLAGKNGGCIMNSGTLKNSGCKEVGIDIKLFLSRWVTKDKFALGAEHSVTEK